MFRLHFQLILLGVLLSSTVVAQEPVEFGSSVAPCAGEAKGGDPKEAGGRYKASPEVGFAKEGDAQNAGCISKSAGPQSADYFVKRGDPEKAGAVAKDLTGIVR